jgi:hypothetical protein
MPLIFVTICLPITHKEWKHKELCGMTKGSASAPELAALIESYELEIDCGHCGWAGQRNLGWLGTHRDMNCPACGGVIVLNTSERRRRISAVRRQVAALHEQLSDSLSGAQHALTSPHSASKAAASDTLSQLGLFRQYGNKAGDAAPRRVTRARR